MAQDLKEDQLIMMMMIVGAEAILGVVGAGDAEAMAQEAVAVSGAQEVTVMVDLVEGEEAGVDFLIGAIEVASIEDHEDQVIAGAMEAVEEDFLIAAGAFAEAIGAVAVDLAIVGAVVVARLLVTVGATDPDRIRKLTTSVFFFFTVS